VSSAARAMSRPPSASVSAKRINFCARRRSSDHTQRCTGRSNLSNPPGSTFRACASRDRVVLTCPLAHRAAHYLGACAQKRIGNAPPFPGLICDLSETQRAPLWSRRARQSARARLASVGSRATRATFGRAIPSIRVDRDVARGSRRSLCSDDALILEERRAARVLSRAPRRRMCARRVLARRELTRRLRQRRRIDR